MAHGARFAVWHEAKFAHRALKFLYIKITYRYRCVQNISTPPLLSSGQLLTDDDDDDNDDNNDDDYNDDKILIV